MNTLTAFAMGEAHRHCELMVFDWDKAAKIIREVGAKKAYAGLRGDWEWTGGVIYDGGEPVKNQYTYLASTWAIPEAMIDGEVIDCYIMQHETKWNAYTKWPQSAVDILNGKDEKQ